MKFYSKKEINDYFEGKTVAVVGSAPSVLENVGGYIDNHDLVVRVNNYKIKGYEDNVGRRCDVHYSFYGSSVKKTPEELLGDGVKLCMCKCPNDKPFHSDWHEQNGLKYGVDFRYIYRKKKDWWFCNTYIPETADFMRQFDMLGKHIPTTGFSCIETILNTNAKRIYITGFDFFESGQHNVDERWREKNTGDPYKHVPQKEKELVLNFKKNDDRIKFDHRLKMYETG